MEYAVVVLLSLLAGGAALGENQVIKVENIQGVCEAINGVSQHIETSRAGSDCVYLMNGPDACKNCLDLNCSIPITASGFTITAKTEVSVLPCHDGNLNVPKHAIDTRILDSSGQELFRRLSDRSFDDSFVFRISTIFGIISVPVAISVTIDNRGNGVSIQADITVSGSQYEVFPQTFIPITCTVVDRSVCFGISIESSTPTPTTTSAGTLTSTSAGSPTTTSAGTLTTTSAGTPTSTSAGTPTPTSQHAGSAGNAGAPPPATAVWPMMLLVMASMAGLHY